MSKENSELNLLQHNDICVVDEKYLLEENSVFYYKSEGIFLSKYFFEDAKNKPIYKCDFNGFNGKSTFKDPKNNRKLVQTKFKGHITKPNELFITCFKNDKEINTVTCYFKTKTTWKFYTYRVTFFNKATEKEELIEVECSGNYKNCNIYYGLKKENGKLICKFDSSKYFTGVNFKIEILPRIDTLFIFCIISQVFRLIQGRKAAAAAS